MDLIIRDSVRFSVRHFESTSYDPGRDGEFDSLIRLEQVFWANLVGLLSDDLNRLQHLSLEANSRLKT